MTRRLRFGILAVAIAFAARAGWAQSWPQGASPSPAAAPAGPIWDPQVAPAGWHGHSHGHHAPLPGPGYAETVYELLPEDRGLIYDTDSMLDLSIRDTIRGSWIRIEYLNFSIDSPADVALGAETLASTTPRVPFRVDFSDGLDPATLVNRVVQVPGTDSVDWGEIGGLKGSIGIPILKMGSVEASIWALNEKTEPIAAANLPADPTIVALTAGTVQEPVSVLVVPLLNNGIPAGLAEPTDVKIMYDVDFQAEYSAYMGSSDINFVYNLRTPSTGWTVQPLIGFRYLEYGETLKFGGSFDNRSGALVGVGQFGAPVSNSIASETVNRLYGGQIGLRTEFIHDRITIGFEPKFTFAGNNSTTTVTTNDLREPGADPTLALDDPFTESKLHESGFAPIFDVGLYARARLTDWFSLQVGYQFTYVGHLATAEQAIYYNDTGLTNPPGVVAKRGFSDRFVEGLTVGGQITLP